MRPSNNRRFLVLAFLAGITVILYAIFHESPEDEAKRKVIEDKAITEVMMRISPTAAFDSISNRESAKYYVVSSKCDLTADWAHEQQVVEYIDIREPAPQRIGLKYCVNSDTSEIKFDNDVARVSSVDDTKYLEAKRYCAGLTDPENSIRDNRLARRYKSVFLKIVPSGEDVKDENFSCTSEFDLEENDSEAAIWKLFPNAWLKPDSPFTPAARQIENQLINEKQVRCEQMLSSIHGDKQFVVRALFGEDPDLALFTRGIDGSDPALSCTFDYKLGTPQRAASWSLQPNSDPAILRPLNDDARAADQFQAALRPAK